MKNKMMKTIGSLTAKLAAILLAFGCAGGAWGATTVAKIGDTEYRSLQDAVNRVTDGQTISLVADCDEAALVARVVTFTITPDAGVNFTGSVAKGSDETSVATASDGNGGTAGDGRNNGTGRDPAAGGNPGRGRWAAGNSRGSG